VPFSITIQGLDPLLAALNNYEAYRDEEYEHASIDALNYLKSPLREYPPEREGQRYRRTFHLQGGWDEAEPTFTPRWDGFDARLENPTTYGPYVQGGPDETPHQAWMHLDRWNTDEAIMRDNEMEIRQFYEGATERLTKRLGG
jgi:hypothetical protein